jgi:tRNA G18 (ribose-2'-O)-methylase SpoU
MPRVPIDDLDDPRIAPYRSLKATNQSRDRNEFVVEGRKLLERLLESRFPIASALVSERKESSVSEIIPKSVPLYVVPPSLVDLLVGFNFHQGVLACGRRIPWPGVAEVISQPAGRLTVVVCPRIDNPENLGAIIRLVDVFGADGLLVGLRCPDPLSRRVLRVSMGMALRVRIARSDNLAGEFDALRDRHPITLAAAVAEPGAIPIGAYRRPERLGLVLGCEGTGLDDDWLARCDQRVTIPMRAGAESLNVAVAAGIILHQLTTPAAGQGGRSGAGLDGPADRAG